MSNIMKQNTVKIWENTEFWEINPPPLPVPPFSRCTTDHWAFCTSLLLSPSSLFSSSLPSFTLYLIRIHRSPWCPRLPPSWHSPHLSSVCSRHTSDPLNSPSDTKACSLGHIMWLSLSVLLYRGDVLSHCLLVWPASPGVIWSFMSHGSTDTNFLVKRFFFINQKTCFW